MCFLLSDKEGRLKVRFKNSKNMSHRYDVTYSYINEAIQKMQNQHHLKLAQQKSPSMKFLIISSKKG